MPENEPNIRFDPAHQDDWLVLLQAVSESPEPQPLSQVEIDLIIRCRENMITILLARFPDQQTQIRSSSPQTY